MADLPSLQAYMSRKPDPEPPLVDRDLPDRPLRESHVERLIEIEQSMLGSMDVLVERVARYETAYANVQDDLREVLGQQRTMLSEITQSQAQITLLQRKLIETQMQLSKTLHKLADRLS